MKDSDRQLIGMIFFVILFGLTTAWHMNEGLKNLDSFTTNLYITLPLMFTQFLLYNDCYIKYKLSFKLSSDCQKDEKTGAN